MFLHEIESGQRILIDANIFVYHFSQDSRFNKSCRDFFLRVEKSEIYGVTSAAVILEATHRIMMSEASSIIDVEVKNLPKYLKQHPDVVKQVAKHLIVPGKIASLGIEIIPITAGLVEGSQVFKTRYGFLSNDALTLKVMEEYQIAAIATNDLDFERVEWIKLYRAQAPDDSL